MFMRKHVPQNGPQNQHSAICVYPEAHLHTNSCCGFHIRPQCSDGGGKVISNFLCFLDNRITWEGKVRVSLFYGWTRSSQQRERKKRTAGVRVFMELLKTATLSTPVMQPAQFTRCSTVDFKICLWRVDIKEWARLTMCKNSDLTSWREQV